MSNNQKNRVRRAERKTRNAIHLIESKCDDSLKSGECAHMRCSQCKVNQKFVDLVGIDMTELIKHESVKMEVKIR